jgi:hypothetical protein
MHTRRLENQPAVNRSVESPERERFFHLIELFDGISFSTKLSIELLFGVPVNLETE